MGKIVKFNVNSSKKNDSREEQSEKDKKSINPTNNTEEKKIITVNKTEENQSKNIENSEISDEVQEFLKKVYKGIEEHVLSVFAVKEVVDIAFVVKGNEKGEIGVLGKLAYHHKRREGLFVATFIAKGYIDKKADKVVINELAFLEGEPDYYATIEKILKAKKIYPEIEENN
jgi:hypothetical protein